MKRLISSIFAALAVAAAANAQPKAGSFSIIPRLGVTLAKVTGDNMHVDENLSLSPKFKPGLLAGADLEYQATNMLAVSVGAFYSRQGERYNDFEEAHDFTTKHWSEMRNVKQHHDYINVPVMMSVYGARNLAFKIGAQIGFNTHAQSEMTTAKLTRDENDVVSTESLEKSKSDVALKKVDFSIPIGISYEYMNVILDARYNIGLTKVYKHLDTGKNCVFSFSAGYRFQL